MFMERKFRAGCRRSSPQEARLHRKSWLNMPLLPGNNILKEESCRSIVPPVRKCMHFLNWKGSFTSIIRMMWKYSRKTRVPSRYPGSLEKTHRTLRFPAPTQLCFGPMQALTVSCAPRHWGGRKTCSCTGRSSTTARTRPDSGGFWMLCPTRACANLPPNCRVKPWGEEGLKGFVSPFSPSVLFYGGA